MSVSRLVKQGIPAVLMVVGLTMVSGVSSASALSPWWHLTSGARPTSIQPGRAQDEVQEVTVSANEGDSNKSEFLLVGPEFNLAFFKWDATHEEVQEGLEGIYGNGNVSVTGGPGDETGSKPYVVTFTGGLAGASVEPMSAEASIFFLECKTGSGPGCRREATVREKTKGRADGQIVVTAANLGDGNANGQTNPVTIADKLPAGLRAVGIEGIAGAQGNEDGPVECSRVSLSCAFAGTLPSFDQIEVVISVVVEGAVSGGMNEVSVSGGEAKSASLERPVPVGGTPVAFGTEDYELAPEEEGGAPDTQAGSHPFQLTTTFTLNQTADGRPVHLAKDLHFKLPPGLVGNPTPFPQCTLAQFNTIGSSATSGGLNLCPAQSAVGVALITISAASAGLGEGAETFTVPIFNLEPAVGEPARFGFELPRAPVFLDTVVRTGEDYGVTVNVSNITQTAAFLKNEVTFWGVPGDPRHDSERGWACLADERKTPFPLPCDKSGALHPPPLLTLPTSCSGSSLQTTVESDSWAEPGSFQSYGLTDPMPTLDGCNRLPFSPTISVTPDSQAGSTPTGLNVGVHVPQDVSLSGKGLAEADVKNTTVTLPAGIAINPAGGDGLQACSEDQIALKSAAPPACPDASKVGLVRIKTPLLPNPLEGAAYLASQNANPFGSLVALYVYVEDPISGSKVKVAGEVELNPVDGQLTTVFRDTPQLPFETFELHMFGGDRAPLASPAHCGPYTTTASIEPWSETGEAGSESMFDILSGPASFDEPAGRQCPGARLPFSPSLTGGATNVNAGAFSPLTLTFSRKDGEQNIQSAEAHLPPGLSGILSNIELCPEPQANLGECPQGSLIGETTVSVGVGGDPFTVGGGKFYLTGPYDGHGSCTVGVPGCAPFGITFEVPAKAGPFDLKRNSANPAGENACDCVIVRGRIEVDPVTAAVTIKSDPPGSPYAIPTSIEGIPLEIQHINATTTRGNFQFNPTNCEKMQVTGTIDSSEDTLINVSVPFQVTNCAILGFKPGFKVSTSGKTSRAKGASLSVHLTYPKAPFGSQANIKSVKVDLPKQLPSRLTTLQKACTAAQFQTNPAGCPAASMVGHATAITPLIPVPLTGPAYFVSYGGAKFPELVIVLQGYGVTLDLHGETFINKAGITSSTFHTVPDAPVGSFELTLPQGPFSALAANGNLCKAKLRMPTAFVAQNGATIKQNTPIGATGCAKHVKAKKKAKHKHKKK
jgi:hypothetical protein